MKKEPVSQPSLLFSAFVNVHRLCENRQDAMTPFEKIRAILTDSHFLIPLIVFCVGLALLITLH
jgi:hypothetical protein